MSKEQPREWWIDKIEKICCWAKMKADHEAADDLDLWETIYYSELERLDDVVKVLGPPTYYQDLERQLKERG